MGALSQMFGGITSGVADVGNASISRENASIADQAAQDAINRGSRAVQRQQMSSAALEGKQVAAYGASGVTANTGSALDVLTDTKFMSDIDQQTIANNAAREGWGYSVKAAQFRQQAGMQDQKAQFDYAGAGLAGLELGGESLLGGG